MRKKLLSMMPEFQLISDNRLREKSIEVWIEAMQQEGWQIEDLQDMPFTLLIAHTPINIIEHTRSVTLCSMKIGEVLQKEYQDRISINRDHLLSGALLHDG